MGSQSAEERYLSQLSKAAGNDHPIQAMLKRRSTGNQRAICNFVKGEVCSDGGGSWQLRKFLSDTKTLATGNKRVYIIENISASWMAILGVAWNLDGGLFLEHARSNNGTPLWDGIIRQERENRERIRDWPQYQYIEGVLSDLSQSEEAQIDSNHVIRRSEPDKTAGYLFTSKISYREVGKNVYLLLVDAPRTSRRNRRGVHEAGIPPKLSLRVPSHGSSAGIPITQLYAVDNFAPAELLRNFLKDPKMHSVLWNNNLGGHHFRDHPLILSHFLAASQWKTNMAYIEAEVRLVAFRDFRRPDISTNDRLHDLREDLTLLHAEVSSAKESVRNISPWHHLLTEDLKSWPGETRLDVLQQIQRTERFLMDTFQLLMSSASVLNAQIGIQNATRGALLAHLATVYAPLSFVMGIWGMNVKEINDSPRPLWMFGVALMVALAAMITVLLALQDRRAMWNSVRAISWKRSGVHEDGAFTQKSPNKIHRGASKVA